MRIWSRINPWFHRRRREAELDRELRDHLELEAEEQRDSGIAPEEAVYAARRALGNTVQIKEDVRVAWGMQWLETLLQDLRYGLRQLRRNPGFTAVAIVTLALGIGANTAIFSLVEATVLKPLPYPEPQQLVAVFEASPQQGINKDGCSYPVFAAWREHNHAFSEMAGYQEDQLTLSGRGEPIALNIVVATSELFTLLRERPLLGRTFLSGEGDSGAPPVVVLSERLWRERFSSDTQIIGKMISLDQRSFTVIGVMPRDFRFPLQSATIDAWIPVVQDPLFGGWLTHAGGHWLNVVARLKPEVSLSRAQTEMDATGARITHQLAPENAGWIVRLVPLHKEVTGSTQPEIMILLAATGFVLLIACANIASLLVARGISRSKEIAIRIALGAGSGRVSRQLLTESVLLGLAGGGGGLVLAGVGLRAMESFLPSQLILLFTPHLDGPVLLFTLLVSVVASLIFGLAPALKAGKPNHEASLKEGGSRLSETRGQGRLRNSLTALEIAIAFVLLVGAGLLLRSFIALTHVDPGFQPERVMTAGITLPKSQYRLPEQWVGFANELVDETRSAPGVHDVAVGVALPLASGYINIAFTIEGAPPLPPGTVVSADYNAVSPEYFRILGIPLLRGRFFTDGDNASAPEVAIISEAMARQHFPNEDPIGKHIVFGFPPGHGVSREIVGVVGDVRDVALNKPGGPTMYAPFAQAPLWGMNLVVRSRIGSASVAALIRHNLGKLDKDLPATAVQPLSTAFGASLVAPRFRTLLLGLFGALALALASVGIYGVISYGVARRRHEIGIRMALGAQKSDVLNLVVGQGMLPALIGVGIGIAAAFGLTRFLASLLYGVKPTDPLTFVAVALILVGVALLACYIPARRAARVDPMGALRHK
jgi:predicted permease